MRTGFGLTIWLGLEAFFSRRPCPCEMCRPSRCLAASTSLAKFRGRGLERSSVTSFASRSPKDSSLLRDACFIGGRKHTAPANLEAWLRAPIVPRGTSFHRSVNAAGEYVEGSRRTEKLAL